MIQHELIKAISENKYTILKDLTPFIKVGIIENHLKIFNCRFSILFSRKKISPTNKN
ncbi:hypothetical protein GM3709_1287 [Geminocystis sp. NIES-3709]|nr:hypothetical protein GM3709_1287 [Geminocystis sp. NIES-3709]